MCIVYFLVGVSVPPGSAGEPPHWIHGGPTIPRVQVAFRPIPRCAESSGVSRAASLLGGTAGANDEPGDERADRDGDDGVVHIGEVVLPLLPVLPDCVAEQREREHPWEAAEDRQHR